MDANDVNTLTNLTGMALGIGVMGYMLRYFMDRDKAREGYITEVISKNTDAVNALTRALRVKKLIPDEDDNFR